MKRLKLFEDYSQKLWSQINDDDSTYCNDASVHFNRGLAEKIIRRLSGEWCGKLVRHAGLWLDLRKGDGNEAIAIHQTEDDYFICEWDSYSPNLFKCDSQDGLLQFLKHFGVII